MITLLATALTWALKNQVIAGGLTLAIGKIYTLAEEWFKRKFFPEKQEVIVQLAAPETEYKPIRKKLAPKKRKDFALYLLCFIVIMLLGYIAITIWSFRFMKTDSMKLDAISEMKLVIILCVAFFLAKLVSFQTTLEEVGKMLPLIKNFIKK